MINDWRLGGDFQMCGRPWRRTGAIEDLEGQGRGFKHGFGGYLDAIPNPRTIIQRDCARPDAHAKERTTIRFLFNLLCVPRTLGQPRHVHHYNRGCRKIVMRHFFDLMR